MPGADPPIGCSNGASQPESGLGVSPPPGAAPDIASLRTAQPSLGRSTQVSPMGRLTSLKPRIGNPNQGGWANPARGSRQARGYGASWDRLRRQVLERDCGVCQACAREGLIHPGNEVDHIVPKAEGGTDDLSNLQTICAERHRLKTQDESARGRGGSKV